MVWRGGRGEHVPLIRRLNWFPFGPWSGQHLCQLIWGAAIGIKVTCIVENDIVVLQQRSLLVVYVLQGNNILDAIAVIVNLGIG